MSVTSDIQQLYVAYFNRPADPIGLAYWTNVANANGGSTAAISAAFSTSPEYTATYAGLSPAEVVNAVYLNLFGRPAEPAGLNYWAPLIGNGKITVANVVTQIAAGAQGTDATALANKVTAATLFTNHLDTSAEILGYTGAAANNVGKAYIASVTDAASLLAATSSVDASITNALAAHTAGTTGATVTLTTGLDTLTSAAGSAVFTANIVNNTNTFQSGDTLTATGAGNTLNADLGNSANFAILATTKGIQTVNITAEAQALLGGGNTTTSGAVGTNNLSNLPVQINALRMANVTNWGDLQSRADVVIENIQLPNGNVSSDVTNAVTFTMRDTQPGNIFGSGGGANAASIGPSFRAYFNPQALKSSNTASSSSVDLGLINSGPTYKSAAPLNTSNYTGFTLNVSTGGAAAKPVNFMFSTADIAAIKASTLATNQAAVATAVNDAVDAYNLANGTNFTHKAGPSVPIFNSIDGTVELIQTTTIGLAGSTVAVGSFNRALTNDQDPTAFIGNYMNPTPIPGSTALITSNVIVDNVGQGGYPQFHNYAGSTEGAGGDLIIGSMASSGGVQQFNIDVQRTSWNDSVQTTNNVLQVVNIVSDAVVVPAKFDTINGGGQGYAIGAEIVPGVGNMINFAAPGTLVGTNGLRDVQTINATGFNGSLEIGERIDYEAFGNYLSGATGVVPFSITLGDQSNGFIVPGNKAAFNSVNLSINSAVAGSGNFLETINGGTGNDIINVIVSGNNLQNNSATPSANGAWELSMTALKNLVINAGAGDNTVMFVGGGAAQINSLAGNDAIYIDNTGGGGAGTVTNIQGGAANLHAVWVANAASATASTVGAPTVVQVAAGTPGTFGTAQVSFVNIAPATAAFSTVEDVAVTATNSGNVTAGNPAGDDLQGIQVIYNQSAGGAGITTSTIAADVLSAYKDYVANHDPVTGLPNEAAPTNTNGGGVITFKSANGGAPTNTATDVMVETFTISPGNTLQVTIGNEYAVAQTATQSAQGIVGLTRTQTGPTSFAFDGQSSATGAAPYSAAPGDAPSANGTTTNGTASATESDNVTFKPLTGTGASESVAGITITNTEPTGTVTFTAAQVAAAVMAGNGTYGNLVVTGEGATTPAVNTGYRPVNEYTALAAGNVVPTVENVNGFTITNSGAALTAAQVAAAVATLGTATVTVTPTNNATVSATDVVLNYDTPNAAPAAPVAGSANGGVVQTTAGTQVSIDQFGNLTTYAPTQTGAAPYTFTGSGETVTVKYEGYSVTATITAANSSAAATYTSTDVNNAIAKAVNNDPTMSKLLHVTQGSANESIILNSLVDGRQSTPSITFAHPVAAGTGTATSLTGADGVALSQYTTVQQATGDGTAFVTNGTTGIGALTGANSTLVNNSVITDSGSSATGANVIDLSSNSAAVNGFIGGSANTVTLTGTGTTIITNYKLADTITTTATHAVILNGASVAAGVPAVQAIFGADGSLKVSAASLGLAPTAGVYEGSTFANATKVAGTSTTGPGLFILENALTKATSVYFANDVSTINAATTVLEATLIGVLPPTTAITLV